MVIQQLLSAAICDEYNSFCLIFRFYSVDGELELGHKTHGLQKHSSPNLF